jgi:hypothetical protein
MLSNKENAYIKSKFLGIYSTVTPAYRYKDVYRNKFIVTLLVREKLEVMPVHKAATQSCLSHNKRAV